MTHFLRKMAAAWIILGSVSVGFAQQQMPPIPTDLTFASVNWTTD